MKTWLAVVGSFFLLGVAVVIAQPPGGPGRGGPPGPPDPARFVEHALQFDEDGDGKLSKEELRKFAEDFARGPGRGPMRPNQPNQPRTGSTASGDGMNHVQISVRDGYRYIEANGLPDHEHGQFPNRGNPNRISEQHHAFRMPLRPQAASTPIDAGQMPFGVALNGVPFDPATAELWRNDSRWRYDALSGKINLGLDQSNAHVQPNGAYHYHGLPIALILKLGKPNEMVLIGYAADGYPIYNQYGHVDPKDGKSELRKLRSSYQLKKGKRPAGNQGPGGEYDGTFNQDFEYVSGSGDLDECNGRFGVTPEAPAGEYHYAVTEQYPFIPRKFRAAPDVSFRRGPQPGGPGGPRQPR